MSKQPEPEILKDLMNECRIFHKLSNIYGWSWTQFKETPWPVIKCLCKILDEAAEDMGSFISYNEYSEFKNLKRLHGTDENKDKQT